MIDNDFRDSPDEIEEMLKQKAPSWKHCPAASIMPHWHSS
jgi:hypothetical protein